jgi:hypothetical protein
LIECDALILGFNKIKKLDKVVRIGREGMYRIALLKLKISQEGIEWRIAGLGYHFNTKDTTKSY